MDYPTRAPEIRLRFLSGAPEKKPQPTSDGGGDSAMVQRDIRVVETEVSFYSLIRCGVFFECSKLF